METTKTKLLQVIYNRDLERLNELLKTNKFSVNLQDDDGKSLIIWATILGYTEIVQFLLKNNADVNYQDSDGCTALIYASLTGYIDIVKLLLKYDVDINHQDNDGCTALICASKMNHVNIIDFLISNGADVNIKDYKNRTAVQWSLMFSNNSNATIFLIKSGANVEDRDENGETILIEAIKQRSLDVIDVLISVGVSINTKTQDNTSALELAKIRAIEYEKIVERLKQAAKKT